MKTILFFGLFVTLLFSSDITAAKVAKLSKKGEKIVKLFCDSKKLPDASGTIEQLIQKIEASKACQQLSKAKLEAVAYYLSNGSVESTGREIAVPSDAKCPVCGMFVGKYPKWAARITVDGKRYYFDGVKDMMKYYIFDADFPYERSKISEMLVSDFYTLEEIDARKAYYVLGSNLYGPMGNELIPFKTLKSAQNFMVDHKGEKIVRFDEITAKMVMALDGIEYGE